MRALASRIHWRLVGLALLASSVVSTAFVSVAAAGEPWAI